MRRCCLFLIVLGLWSCGEKKANSWVLWVGESSTLNSIAAYETRDRCVEELGKLEKFALSRSKKPDEKPERIVEGMFAMKGEGGGFSTCLPDTVDPRPRGKE